MKTHPANAIFQKDKYIEEVERRIRLSGHSDAAFENDRFNLNLHSLYHRRKALGGYLAQTVRKGQYSLAPAKAKRALIEGKKRVLYHSQSVDAVVISLFAGLLEDLVAPMLSDSLFSYRKGRSSTEAVVKLAEYISKHSASRPNPLARGLYVIKRDIDAYGESISTGPDSRLWQHLEEAVNGPGTLVADHPFWKLLHSMIRRKIITLEGRETLLERGVSTGSPIQPVLNNLYLADMDRHLESIEGAFYARYGDDFIFAHPDFKVAKGASAFIDRTVSKLELSIGEKKRVDLYLTKAGRLSESWQDTVNTHNVEYLGCLVGFNGNIGLKRNKQRDMLANIKSRIANTASLLAKDSVEKRCEVIIDTVNRALNPLCQLSHKSAHLLRYTVDDREQLKHLDYLIALAIAGEVAGIKGVKAFRKVSYRKLRNLGLKSLVVEKNNLFLKRGANGKA